MNKGFTLIEILVTVGIAMVLVFLLLGTFSRFSIELDQTRLQVIAALREVQTLSLTGASLTSGAKSCGYGIHFTTTSYTIFSAPAPDPVTGCAAVYTYVAGTSIVVRTVALTDAQMVFASTPSAVPPDIFLLPPFFNVVISDGSNPAVIYIKKVGAACPSSDCRTVNMSIYSWVQ